MGNDFAAAFLGIILGAAFIVWWLVGNKKESNNQQRPNSRQPSSSPRHTDTAPSATAKNNEPKQDRPPSPKPPIHLVPPSASVQRKKLNPIIPTKKDGATLAYRYNIPFTPSNSDIAQQIMHEEQHELSAKQVGQEIHLFHRDFDLGVLTERVDMLSDWLRRGDPYLIILEQAIDGIGYSLILVFYKDKKKQHAHREQTVIALTGYKSESKQNLILSLETGDELEIEENPDKEDQIIVSYLSEVIGSLPKKYAQRYIKEGAALVVLDHTEEDEETFVSKPFVRIYW